ncbi:Intracellular distribution of mitochondria, partial [Nowakowskiella sp. JEL0078]
MAQDKKKKAKAGKGVKATKAAEPQQPGLLVAPPATADEAEQLLTVNVYLDCASLEKLSFVPSDPSSSVLERLNDATLIEALLPSPDTVITKDFFVDIVIVDDLYNDKEVRVHIARIREFLSNFSSAVVTNGFGVAESFSLCFVSDLLPQSFTSDENGNSVEKPNSDVIAKSNGSSNYVNPFESYDFDAPIPTSLANFVPENYSTSPIKCLELFSLSPWNPPPYDRKLAGDVMYLLAKTVEHATLHITCSVSGFYISNSTTETFDPTPHQTPHHNHSLPALLSAASPFFSTNFTEIQDRTYHRHPFEYVITNTPSYPWVVNVNQTIHTSDPSRSLDQALAAPDLASFRDWNEELQSARELPTPTVQDRLMRDQSIQKTYAEFADAATMGAMAVVDRCVAPLNPTDSMAAQIFIHNNIFFSFADDTRDQFVGVGGGEAARVVAKKDVLGVQALSNVSNEIFTLGTVVVDYKGMRIVAQSIVPGILKRSVADTPTVVYGSVDQGKEVAFDNEFHVAVAKVARTLHFEEHEVLDGKGSKGNIYTSLESKGIKGDDGRLYLLDLYRVTPTDIAFLDEADKDGLPAYPHRMALLRKELIEAFVEQNLKICLTQARAKVDEAIPRAKDGKLENPPDYDDQLESALTSAMAKFEYRFNMDAFSPLTTTSTEAQQNVRDASRFLTNTVIPSLIVELVDTPTRIPLDGAALTKYLHSRGINLRYLGKIAKIFESIRGYRVEYIKTLAVQEMVARGAKHVLRRLMRGAASFQMRECVATFLNCLVGDGIAADELKVHKSVTSAAAHRGVEGGDWKKASRESVWREVREEVKRRFRYQVGEGWLGRTVPLVRSVCRMVGIQIVARDYGFGSGGVRFEVADIVNVYPVVTVAEPKATFGDEVWEHAQMNLNQGSRDMAVQLMVEASTIYEQVYGPVHPECCRIYANLAMVYFQNEEIDIAKEFQRKAVIVAERTAGVDDADTLQQYMNLAYFEFVSGNVDIGLLYMRHALKYWELLSAEHRHPDLASADSNIAAMLQKQFPTNPQALKFHERAVSTNAELLGKEHLGTLAAGESLARAYVTAHELRRALEVQRGVYKSMLAKFGKENERTKEAEALLRKITQHAVSDAMDKQAEKEKE